MKKMLVLAVLMSCSLLSFGNDGSLRTEVMYMFSGPSVGLSCTAPTPVSGKVDPSSYNFYRGIVKGGPYSTLVGNSGGTNCSFTDVTVAYSTTYYYVAKSVDGAKESVSSTE